MASDELKSARLQRSAGADATNNGLHLFRTWLREEELQRITFLEMFEAYRPRFLALAHSILRNREDAEDAVYNAFLSAYRNLRKFEGRSALTTWFTRIVFNAALMIQRKRRRSGVVRFSESSTSYESNWTDRIVSSQPDPEMVHGERETFQLIHDQLNKMNPSLRQAFWMIHFEELSIREACARLELPTTTFKARLFRARQQLSRRVRRIQVAPSHQAKFAAGSTRPPCPEAWPSREQTSPR